MVDQRSIRRKPTRKERGRIMQWSAAALVGLVGGASAHAQATESVQMRFLSSGLAERLGRYTPRSISLSAERPATLAKLPDAVASPRFGVFSFGTLADGRARVLTVLIDDRADGVQRMYIDSNANGNLADDAAVEWQPKPAQSERRFMHYTGAASIPLVANREAPAGRLEFYRFDPSDPLHSEHRDKLFYYADYGVEGEATLGGELRRFVIADEAASGDFRKREGLFLFSDLDRDAALDAATERFALHQPLRIGAVLHNVTGLTAVGDSMTLTSALAPQQAKQSEPQGASTTAPTKLTPSGDAVAFTAQKMDGATVNFPADYKGKLVLLDFWATWCGPCVKELPGLSAAYEKYHSQGLEVLSVSLDRPSAEAKIADAKSTYKMNWAHVYEGQFWNSRIARLYNVRGIPAPFLVDGTSGKVIAKGGELRGPQLAKTIEAALASIKPPAEAPKQSGGG